MNFKYGDNEDILAVVWKGYSLSKVIINESLNLKGFLMISIFIITQYIPWNMNLGANFISKMSKLFGEVGRVYRRIFVQTYFCPYICPKFRSFFFFIGPSPKSYQTDTWGLFYSYIGHICTKCCIYHTNISPIYHKTQGHISVIWIWEKSEKFSTPPPPFWTFSTICDIFCSEPFPYQENLFTEFRTWYSN